jgi:cobalt-zinc-cadmium efflux system membrane fusion protein
VIDAASDTCGVRLVLPNPDRAIPAGIRCTVEWSDEKRAMQ